MDKEKFVSKVKELCESNGCRLLVVLYDKANEKILKDRPDDYYDFPVYTIVYGLTKESKDSSFLYDLEREEDIHIRKEDLESYESLKILLERLLQDHTEPETIYLDNTYAEPDKIITSLNRIGLDIKIDTSRIYSISISYDELKKLNINKPHKFYESDLFNVVCNSNKELERLSDGNSSIFLYKTRHLQETRYDEKGLTFYFKINVSSEILHDSLNPYGETKHSSLLKAFEEEGLDKDIREMFESIIELDEHNSED